MTTREIVLAKLGEAVVSDPVIDMAIEECQYEIIQYIKKPSIPEGLKYTHANMAVDVIRYQEKMNSIFSASGESIETLPIGTINMGDSEIKFGIKSTDSGAPEVFHKPSLDKLLMNYISQLNRHRTFTS